MVGSLTQLILPQELNSLISNIRHAGHPDHQEDRYSKLKLVDIVMKGSHQLRNRGGRAHQVVLGVSVFVIVCYLALNDVVKPHELINTN